MTLLFEHSLTTPIFVGRLAELQALREFIDQMQSRRGQAVLIAGEAGIGKSRLLAEVQTYAVAQGCLPFRISCFQSDSALPYAPLFAPLQKHLLPASHSTDIPQFLSLLEELALLLPELAPPSSPLSARLHSHHLEPEQKKYRLLTTLNDFFAQLALRRTSFSRSRFRSSAVAPSCRRLCPVNLAPSVWATLVSWKQRIAMRVFAKLKFVLFLRPCEWLRLANVSTLSVNRLARSTKCWPGFKAKPNVNRFGRKSNVSYNSSRRAAALKGHAKC